MKSFTVTLTFTGIDAENALAAAKIVAKNFLDDPDSLTYRVINEKTKGFEDIEGLYDEEDDWEDEEDYWDDEED